MGKGIGGHTRPNAGASDVWLTPRWILDAIGPFDLDPCPSLPQPWPTAAGVLCSGGLTRPWVGRVWLNPPYGPQLGSWLARLADHGRGTAICFARTETRAFFRAVWGRASGLLFLRGRVHFCHPDGTTATGNAGGPSVLIAYGGADAERLRASRLAGTFLAGGGEVSGRTPSLLDLIPARECD